MQVGHGIFMWDVEERREQRYGFFFMAPTTFDEKTHVSATLDTDYLAERVGKRVKAYCIVTESRQSNHAGDRAIDVLPSTPADGERVDIGVGLLVRGTAYDGSPSVGIQPSDGRCAFWTDPRSWYRLHDQTVDLFVEETEEPFSEVPPFRPVLNETAFSVGDGSGDVQFVGGAFEPGETVFVEPTAKPVEGIAGAFSLKLEYPARVRRRR